MDNAKCRALIRKYKEHQLLWNGTNKNYHNKLMREDAWKMIAREINSPVAQLKKKMISLMGSYRREKSRQKKSLTNDSGQGRVYVSKWFAIDCFDFLNEKDAPLKTADTIKTEIFEETNSDVGAGSDADIEPQAASFSDNLPPEKSIYCHAAPTTPAASDTTMNHTADTVEADTMLREAFKILQKSVDTPTDTYSTFAQHLANELRKYDPQTLTRVKHAINNVIFEADMGKYSGQNTDSDCKYYTDAS